jgi:hypothetical protein
VSRQSNRRDFGGNTVALFGCKATIVFIIQTKTLNGERCLLDLAGLPSQNFHAKIERYGLAWKSLAWRLKRRYFSCLCLYQHPLVNYETRFKSNRVVACTYVHRDCASNRSNVWCECSSNHQYRIYYPSTRTTP